MVLSLRTGLNLLKIFFTLEVSKASLIGIDLILEIIKTKLL
jgi:hypothetical protein